MNPTHSAQTLPAIMVKTVEQTETPLYPILLTLRDQLQAYLGDTFVALILFGSYARGEAHAESDVDLLLVVDWQVNPLPNGFYPSLGSDPRWREIIGLAHDISLAEGVYLSVVVQPLVRYQSWSPLKVNIEREGIVIWMKKNGLISKPTCSKPITV